jgi:hypothetical protein
VKSPSALLATSVFYIVMVTGCSVSQVDLKASAPALVIETNFSADEVRACAYRWLGEYPMEYRPDGVVIKAPVFGDLFGYLSVENKKLRVWTTVGAGGMRGYIREAAEFCGIDASSNPPEDWMSTFTKPKF